ncbi:hypothetical protein GQ597_04025 [Gilliamella sp. Pra-s65]|uniref:hypothetical protein n=1 Tax=unclassified Gilliamella TaxID=2685620 RepID=UPI001365FC28|nr:MULTISPECIES: hypothetical protein [unclassified Gilliamella]MWN89879.1 hypothetical protein [Gilliamella sp. Pra-s65]MWP73051.1 hypothetical protein [Gilliamella sp. Pra-s52]
MKTLRLVLAWLFGVLFILLGIANLTQTPLIGIVALLVGISLLPITYQIIYKNTQKEVSSKKKAIITTVLIVVWFIICGIEGGKEREEQEKTFISEFNLNKKEIVSQINQLIIEKKYDEAVSLADKYHSAKDQTVLELADQARLELLKLKNQQKIDDLLNKLKDVPETELEKQIELYDELLTVDPENSEYKTQNAKLQKELERQKLINSQFSSWDGSHRNLEKYIKSKMNDPDSFKHVETKYIDNGSDNLIIITSFRGKNAFGGVIVNTVTATVDLDGNITSIISWK